MPMSPDEVVGVKTSNIPEWVFKVWDKLIAHEWNGRFATVSQKDAILALQAANGGEVKDIFATGWLEIEDSYRAVGWSVIYDKPGYNESYGATFTFKKK